MRLHEVLLSWDLDDLDDFVEAKPRQPIDLIYDEVGSQGGAASSTGCAASC